MKNRILGITAFLAVVVLGFVFVVSCGPGEDTTLDFINKTAVVVTVTTDSGTVTLEKAKTQGTLPTKQLKKSGGEIEILGFEFSDAASITKDNWSDFIELEINTVATGKTKKKDKNKILLGSGSVTFLPIDIEDNDAMPK